MAKTENELDIYYVVGNVNTSRQEIEIGEIMKKRNLLGSELITNRTNFLDRSNQFSKFVSLLGETI